MKKQLLIASACLLALAACSNHTDEVEPQSEDVLQLAMTRAAEGETATVAGFKADGTLSFSKEAYSNGTQWLWRDGQSPSRKNLTQVVATQPLVTINSTTKTLNQSELTDYPKGLKIGVTPLADYLTHGVTVKQCLAQMQISCEGTYFLNTSINLYLCDRGTLDFVKGTFTASNSSKSWFTQVMENDRNATLTILPQTFRKGETLFSYLYNKSTYTYRFTEDVVVGANQRLNVRIASGEEDVYTPEPEPEPSVSVTITSSIDNWLPGNGDKGQSGSAEQQ